MLLKTLALRSAELGVRATAHLVRAPVLRLLYQRALRGLAVTLCLHRVQTEVRDSDPVPQMSLAPATLDRFLTLVAADRGPAAGPRLSLAFDDGYADAVAYVASRAPRCPQVEWLLFVCPEKTARQAGFRWDLYELRRRRGVAGDQTLAAFTASELDCERENERPELREVARRPEFRLATVAECRAAASLSNVRLGNHSNTHFNLCALAPEQAEQELRRSMDDFAALFGVPADSFAFAFGGPGVHFRLEHVEMLRRLGNPVMWSTAGAPYEPARRGPGAVLPRFVFERRFSADAMVLWIALHGLRFRLRRYGRARARDKRRLSATGTPPRAAA